MVERTLLIVTFYVYYFVINDTVECTDKDGRFAPVNRQVMRMFSALSHL